MFHSVLGTQFTLSKSFQIASFTPVPNNNWGKILQSPKFNSKGWKVDKIREVNQLAAGETNKTSVYVETLMQIPLQLTTRPKPCSVLLFEIPPFRITNPNQSRSNNHFSLQSSSPTPKVSLLCIILLTLSICSQCGLHFFLSSKFIKMLLALVWGTFSSCCQVLLLVVAGTLKDLVLSFRLPSVTAP